MVTTTPDFMDTAGQELSNSENGYGGCEGADAMYVKLISSDGHEFIVKREHALTSGTIKAMLSGKINTRTKARGNYKTM